LKINLTNLVAGTVVILMFAVKKESNRNALTRIVVMVRCEEEAVGVAGIVVAIVVSQVQVLLVYIATKSPNSVLIIFEPIT